MTEEERRERGKRIAERIEEYAQMEVPVKNALNAWPNRSQETDKELARMVEEYD